jgi:hypothetical protein
MTRAELAKLHTEISSAMNALARILAEREDPEGRYEWWSRRASALSVLDDSRTGDATALASEEGMRRWFQEDAA